MQGVGNWTPTFEKLPPQKNKIFPSTVQTPILELKPLPSTLKYAFLGEHKTFPMVISSSLEPRQEEELLQV